MHSRCRTLAPGALVLSLLLAGPALAGDPLDEVKARQEVDAKRVLAVVSSAEQEASRLAQSRKLPEAVAVLRSALAEVEDCTSLPEERRNRLKTQLNGLIRQFDPSTAPPPVVKAPVSQPTRTGPDVNRGVADTAGGVIGSRSGALADNRIVKAEREKGMLGVGNEVFKSSIYPTMDYTLPADWIEKSKKRMKQTQMTDRERAILRELNTTRSVEFKGETFQDVINYLSKTTGQTITVPRNVLEEAGVTYETPIKLEMKNVTTRSILKKLLADINLTYIIKDEAIEITTPERARATLTTRTYYVGDLVSVFQNRNLPAVVNQAQMVQQINSLAAMIINTYDPESWQAKGGPGSITFDPITMTFVVRQTAEMHFLMGVGMR